MTKGTPNGKTSGKQMMVEGTPGARGAPGSPGARVLDASAVMAWLQEEQGAEIVDGYLSVSYVSTVNLSEVLQKSAVGKVGVLVSSLDGDLASLGVTFVDFGPSEADVAARMWPLATPLGLGIADRACLATAVVLGIPALTADRPWKDVEWEGLRVEVIR